MLEAMRVIFLDMDGVLNSAEYFATNPDRDPHHPEYIVPEGDDSWWTCMVDRIAVRRLNTLVEVSDAKVVISSSWRDHCDPEQMQRILDAREFTGEVIARTPLATEMPKPLAARALRGLEVEVWLTKNKHLDIEKFVILDDLGENSFAHMTPYLVQTSWARGLLDEHITAALKMLAG